ncbi:MAG: hypothetical protein RI911_52 [Candidatus Parcubacteria bacterium]|jgi:putative Holliday junction resolvase
MKYMGIDVGTKRIGIALSDERHSMAFPLKTITVGADTHTELQTLAKDTAVTKVIIGYSLDRDNLPNPIAAFAHEIATTLRACAIEVVFEWEGYSSAHARRLHTFRDGQPRGVIARKTKQKHERNVDASAAALILQSYLDRM